MNRKTRLLIGFGATAAGFGIAAGVRHCLRSMAQSGDVNDAAALCGGHCGPADRPRAKNGQCAEPTALAA